MLKFHVLNWVQVKKDQNYAKLAFQPKERVQKAHEDYISGDISQSLSDGNPKKFFSYLKLKSLLRSTFQKMEDIMLLTPSKAAALIAQYFTVFTHEELGDLPNLLPSHFTVSIS